ncbi:MULTISPECIES: hypothetical protein [unclassified Sphingomonas]|uniref:hypothetical protein n=1 Tax=unclassified Sphingomonas TaxID=196159 RepID=UPI00226A8A92|nr:MULTISPECIES: hypothetical protein [unclassified Sphingomonas]
MDLHWSSGSVVPLTSRSSEIPEDAILQLVEDHRQLGELCDLLECCADDLPTLPPAPVVEKICGALRELYDPGEATLPPYPDVTRMYDTADPLAAVLLEQVQARHAADATHAEDLADALRGSLDIAERPSPNMLGYMLRCFFDGCRQAMDCEELAILALARHRLTAAARFSLTESLRHRAGRRRSVLS